MFRRRKPISPAIFPRSMPAQLISPPKIQPDFPPPVLPLSASRPTSPAGIHSLIRPDAGTCKRPPSPKKHLTIRNFRVANNPSIPAPPGYTPVTQHPSKTSTRANSSPGKTRFLAYGHAGLMLPMGMPCPCVRVGAKRTTQAKKKPSQTNKHPGP